MKQQHNPNDIVHCSTFHDKPKISYTYQELEYRLIDLAFLSENNSFKVVNNPSQRDKTPEAKYLMLDSTEQAQLKMSILSMVAAVDYPQDNSNDLFFHLDSVEPLPKKVHDAIYGKAAQSEISEVEKPQTIVSKVFNPTTLSFGALCAFGAWYAAKNSTSN